MSEPANATGWVRPLASRTLAWAAVVSLVVHLALYSGYRVVKSWHWAGYEKVMAAITPKPSDAPAILMKWLIPKPKPEEKKSTPRLEPRELAILLPQPPPQIFVPVDPLAATQEEPPQARYYSDKNSRAANPEIKKESDQPNLDGKQTRIPRATESAPTPVRPQPQQNPQPRPPDRQPAEEAPEADVARPLQPATAPPQPEPRPPAERQPPGNLALARPSEALLPQPPPRPPAEPGPERPATPPARVRTLVEAKARMQDNAIAGQKMKQEGGVKNRLAISALDAKATPFGAYDAMIVAAVQQRWYDLLERARFSGDRRGVVVVDFQLHASGRVSDVELVESTVGDFLASLCQMAITDPSPYAKWPPEMQRLFQGGVRKVRFTFYYD
ncbi:hypothetical protein NXS98_13015 [Fontisphaera persica]|uniref:hypothetical protein n=1 Tax=Fontisphaera persica TaxID=2974023 RepID=UPI0024C08696|nr:hypothetical protein [Fontisphaera persica]WCJ58634.1 hypothetical protein NXS98_13015 [Fontisphaera persica]